MASQFFSMDLASDAEADDMKQKGVGTGITFCPECNNMLTPHTPEGSDELYYECKHCGRKELASSNRVYVNILKRTAEDSFLSKRSVADDPTLRRVQAVCPQCQDERTCVVFLAPSRAGEEQFKQLLECTDCRYQWHEAPQD